MRKNLLIGMCIFSIFLFWGIRKIDENRNNKLRAEYISKFEAYYQENIKGEEKKIIAYLNDIPIYDKDVKLFHSISMIEHEYYNQKEKIKEEVAIEDALANVVMDTFYTDLATRYYDVSDLENKVEEVKNHLMVQSKMKSPIVSATSHIRLTYFEEFQLWFNAKYCFSKISDKILNNKDETISKEKIGEVVLTEIVNKSDQYVLKFENTDEMGIDKKKVVELLREYKFIYQ